MHRPRASAFRLFPSRADVLNPRTFHAGAVKSDAQIARYSKHVRETGRVLVARFFAAAGLIFVVNRETGTGVPRSSLAAMRSDKIANPNKKDYDRACACYPIEHRASDVVILRCSCISFFFLHHLRHLPREGSGVEMEKSHANYRCLCTCSKNRLATLEYVFFQKIERAQRIFPFEESRAKRENAADLLQ